MPALRQRPGKAGGAVVRHVAAAGPLVQQRGDQHGGDGQTTLGEVLAADLLAGLDARAFVDRVLASLPAAPASYDRTRAINAGSVATVEEQQELAVRRNQCAAAALPVTARHMRCPVC